LLVCLKATLAWRMVMRNLPAFVAVLLALAMFVPMSVLMGIGCWLGFTRLPSPVNFHLLRAVLTAAYLIWLLSPLLGMALTEEYDIAKLLLYPISPRTLALAATLSAFVDVGMFMLLPSMEAVVVAFARSPATLLATVAALTFFLFHTTGVTQAVRLFLWGVLRSRRGRDIMMLVWGVITFGLMIVPQVILHRMKPRDMPDTWTDLLSGSVWHVVDYLPPGIAARAIGAATQGAYLTALTCLLVLGTLAAATLWVNGRLVHLIYTGEGSLGRASKAPKGEQSRVAPVRAFPLGQRLLARLPPVVWAVAWKEAKIMARDPMFKFQWIGTMLMLPLIFVMTAWNPAFENFMPRPEVRLAVLWAAPALLMFMQAPYFLNHFGSEGAAAAVLFTLPGTAREILIGKNIPAFVVMVGLAAVIEAAACLLLHALSLFPLLLLWSAVLALVILSLGNLSSVWAPTRMVVKGWRPQTQSSGLGIYEGLVRMVVFTAAVVVCLPVLAGLYAPLRLANPLWFIVTIPLTVCYVAVCYLRCLREAERQLERSVDAMVRKLSEPD